MYTVCMPSETPVNIHEEPMQSIGFCAVVNSPFYSQPQARWAAEHQAICDLLTVREAVSNENADVEDSDGHHMGIKEVTDGITHFYYNGHDSRFPPCRAICQ